MLTVEEQQNSIRYSIKLDHCYTSRLSPSDPKPKDPLPVIDSPTSDDGSQQYVRQLSPVPGTSKTSSPVGEVENTVALKPKTTVKTVSAPPCRLNARLSQLYNQHIFNSCFIRVNLWVVPGRIPRRFLYLLRIV